MNPLKQAVDNYQMSQQSKDLLASSPIVMLVSITGGGKNTIIGELLKTNAYHYVISHTTRKPRINNGEQEQNGVNYWFVSEQEMLTKLSNGDFIEAKWVHDSYVYGTSINELQTALRSDKAPLLEIDVQGVEEIQRAKPDATAIFIVPPDYETWMQRLSGRGEVVDDELQKRIITAAKELETALANPSFKFLVNDDLKTAINSTQMLINGEDLQTNGREIAKRLLEQIQA